MLYSTLLYSTLLYYTILYYILYYTILYYTILYPLIQSPGSRNAGGTLVSLEEFIPKECEQESTESTQLGIPGREVCGLLLNWGNSPLRSKHMLGLNSEASRILALGDEALYRDAY